MIDGLKRYSEYKESAQVWISAVPRHWSVLPNRALFAEVKDRDRPGEEMLSVTITQGVIPQKSLLAASSKKDSSNLDKSAYKLLCPHDLAYNKMRAWQGAIGVSNLRGIVSPAYVVMRLRDSQNVPRYFHYLYRTPHFAKEAERWSYGITSDMWSLRPEQFKLIYTPQPPPDEQAAIVRFLDHANGKVERAIRAKRKLISLLNEQKQAIVHSVITRGLDRSVPLKPSGVPWIGMIPIHWEVWRISRFARVGNGSTPSRGKTFYWSGGSFPWINSSQVNRGFIEGVDQFVTKAALRECHLPIVPKGSVLVAITGQGKTRGMVAVLGIEATINQHVAYISPRLPVVSPEFLKSALSAAYGTLRQMSDDSGSTKGALTCEDLKRFKVALPPISEQAELSEYVRNETTVLRIAVSRAEREIAVLHEFRNRLVCDVVTGKLDVRDAVKALSIEDATLQRTRNSDLDTEGEVMPDESEEAES